MTQGIKVSKPGYDISSTEPRDFVLNSIYNTAVIYKEEEVSVTINANSDAISTVNYGETFDYYPVVLIYVQLNSAENKWYLSPFTFWDYDDINTYIKTPEDPSETYVGQSSFTIKFHNNESSQKTIKYRYYLFMNLV